MGLGAPMQGAQFLAYGALGLGGSGLGLWGFGALGLVLGFWLGAPSGPIRFGA